jgi:hypothetical protein
MTAIAITTQGPVTGTNSALVAAAAYLVEAIPQQTRGRTHRLVELIAAVRTPLDELL